MMALNVLTAGNFGDQALTERWELAQNYAALSA